MAARLDKPATTPGSETGRSNTRRDLLENRIIDEATRLFAERGFSGTSLKDIADAAGLTRSAIYHYVRNKDELLAQIVAELAQGPAVLLREISALPHTSPLEKLRRMAYIITLQQASNAAGFQVLIRSEADIADEHAEPYQQGRRDVLHTVMAVIDEGIKAGQMRPVDSRVAALSILGQCNWVAWWHHPTSKEKTEHVAESIADLAVASVAAERADDLPQDASARALAMLKRDVAYLEQVLGSEGG